MTAAAFARYAGIYLACGVVWALAPLATVLWFTRKAPVARQFALRSKFLRGPGQWLYRALLWPVHIANVFSRIAKLRFGLEHASIDLCLVSIALFFAFRGNILLTVYPLATFVLEDAAGLLYAPVGALAYFVDGAAHGSALKLALASLLLALHVLGQHWDCIAAERRAKARAEFERE